jgi:hypothetical protein
MSSMGWSTLHVLYLYTNQHIHMSYIHMPACKPNMSICNTCEISVHKDQTTTTTPTRSPEKSCNNVDGHDEAPDRRDNGQRRGVGNKGVCMGLAICATQKPTNDVMPWQAMTSMKRKLDWWINKLQIRKTNLEPLIDESTKLLFFLLHRWVRQSF